MEIFELLIFAMLAGFLVLRLRSVLGRRTGNERPPLDPFAPRAGQPREPLRGQRTEDDKVVTLPDRSDAAAVDAEDGVAAGLARMRGTDSDFDAAGFLDGARGAFEMVVNSFAAGDRDTLRPLLSDEVYDNFSRAIDEREDQGHVLETTVVGVREADIIEATMDGRVAFLTVKFVSDQINATRDRAGAVVDGDASRVASVTDIWTFARNTRSRNPNWTLVATDAPN